MSGMKQRAMAGARWTVGARLSRALIGIGTMAVLARFLSPADYGIMALILFVTSLAQMLADFGLRVALVQRRQVSDLEMHSVFWANMAVGVLLTAAVLIWAEPIAALFQAPGLETALRQVSPVFLLNSLQGVSMSVLERRFNFRSIALGEIAGGICGALTAIVMVLRGFTVEAVVAQQVVFSLVGAVVIIARARWRPALRFSWAALRPLIAYGGYVALGSGAQFLSNQIDRPILARAISPLALGYFSVANQIVLSPILIVVQAVARVMFPILSAIQGDLPRVRQAYLKIQHAIVVVMAPICLGITAVADPFVRVLLGPGWEPVVGLLILLSIRGLFTAVNRVNGALLAAQGQARMQFRWSVFSAAVYITGLALAAPYGVMAAIGTQLALVAVTSPVYAMFALRQIRQGWAGFLGSIVRPLGSAVVMCLAVRALLSMLALSAVAELLIGMAVGATIYAAIMLAIDRDRVLPLLQGGLARGIKV